MPALAAIARQNGALSVLDNTWAGPTGFPALSNGIDITLMVRAARNLSADFGLGAVPAPAPGGNPY